MLEYFKTRQATANVLLVAIFFGLGVYIGFNPRPEVEKVTGLFGKETAVETLADFSPFWRTWNSINEKYPNQKKATDQERIYGAISGLVNSLGDPYSVFFSPEDAKLFEDDIEGAFGGVGIEIGIKDKILTVIAPLKDTPAWKKNIKSGDKILKINDKVTSGMGIEEAIKLIRGEEGTEVGLTIFREGEGEPREIKITRGTMSIPTLDTELRSDGIFVIKLYSFSANSPKLFQNALREFTNTGSDKLLLDLRGNPGGYLEAAVSMASWFLEGGKIVVTEDYGENSKPKVYRSQGYNVFSNDLKFVILIDGGSASASEILVGAMQDYEKATLVGSQSYGKGSVQEVVKITPDTLLKITVARWLTPNGSSITEKGLTPDVKVPFSTEDIKAGRDPQLKKAIEILLN